MQKDSFVNISFVDDLAMVELNKKHRGKNYATDVLSFNIDEAIEDGRFYLGDIVVNLNQAKRQADESGHSLEKEIADLVSHGMLHLQGVHHEGDE